MRMGMDIPMEKTATIRILRFIPDRANPASVTKSTRIAMGSSTTSRARHPSVADFRKGTCAAGILENAEKG